MNSHDSESELRAPSARRGRATLTSVSEPDPQRSDRRRQSDSAGLRRVVSTRTPGPIVVDNEIFLM
jgi:hypothetical protein